MTFSDYVIYADESGTPILSPTQDEEFPIFVLVFLVVKKETYCQGLVPAIQRLKFDFLGHDQVVLHERDIRRQSGAFAFLQVSADLRERFIDRLNRVIEEADIEIVCTIIDKRKLAATYSSPWSPYDLALTFCLEKAAKVISNKKEDGREVHVIFEARGRTEDKQLELTFRRVAGGNPIVGRAIGAITDRRWTPLFADKRSNSTGLQLADLVARPLGLRYLRPTQVNRAADILARKVCFPRKVFP